MSYMATSGLLVWVEGDKNGEWYTAHDWQYKQFVDVEKIYIKDMKEYISNYIKKITQLIKNNLKKKIKLIYKSII